MSPTITSPSNPRIKHLVRLRTRRERDRADRFLIEGFRELSRAVDAGIVLETLYFCRDFFLGGNEPGLLDAAARLGAELVEVSETAFQRASYRDRPEGLLAVAPRFDTSLSRIGVAGAPLILVAESIEKPGNLGTMLRTAEAAGATGVIAADPTTDPFNPNVVRASLGTLFTLPLAVASTPEAITFLRDNGIASLAASPAASMTIWDWDLRGPTALVVGSEQLGLSDEWLQGAEAAVAIPMPGSIDSLNAAMAAGILLFEAVRQRG